MTLPELLIGVTLTGLLIAVLTSAISVIVRQQDNTNGRTNNARSEQGVGLWMPSDLASAADIDVNAAASPCAPDCPANVNVGGSNALMLSWDEQIDGGAGWVTKTTTVSYRYVQVGNEFLMLRVECIRIDGGLPTCKQNVVVHDLEPPPIGQEWIPGTTKPFWVIQVSQPPDPADTSGPGVTVPVDPQAPTKNAQRVIVTINGGGDGADGGGGQHQISLSAGGTNRIVIPADNGDVGVPSFTEARSRCGGNIALVADTSGSIQEANMVEVRKGIRDFVNAFAGTPVKIELDYFSTTAHIYGDGGGGIKYYDMLNDADVAALLVATNGTSSSSPKATLLSNGYTNWEDALHRLFRDSAGNELTVTPDMIVFFTDGVPTKDRQTDTWAPSAPKNPPAAMVGLPAATGSYKHEAWARANALANVYRGQGIRWIGVGVGNDIYADPNATYVPAPQPAQQGYSAFVELGDQWHPIAFRRGFHWTASVGYHWENVQRGSHLETRRANAVVWERGNNVIFEVGSNNMTYWRKQGSSWTLSNQSNYFSNNTVAGDADGWRAVASAIPTGWTTISQANYTKSNLTMDSTDGFRVRLSGSTASSWTGITQAQYNSGNTVAGTADGFRTRVNGSITSWVTITQAEYNLSNTTTDTLDGFDNVGKVYTSPYTSWEASTDAAFVAAVPGAGTNSAYAVPTGWQATSATTSPFSHNSAVTEAAFLAANPSAANNLSFVAPAGWTATSSTSSPYTQWSPVSEATYLASNPNYVSNAGWAFDKDYSAPFLMADYTLNNMKNKEIMARFITGTNTGTEANADYSNAEQADMYVTPDWAKFTEAMQAIALSQCGGTVTLQTKVDTGGPAQDQFTYQHTASTDSTGTALQIQQKVVYTKPQFVSGTFDFKIEGSYIDLEITQVPTVTLEHYTPVSWSCKVGGVTKTFTPVPDPSGGPWQGLNIRLRANEAVSCTQLVHRTS